MPSFSNLYADQVTRLRNDETGEVTFLFARDGAPLNISEMAFSVGFCTLNTITEKLRLDIPKASTANPGTELVRPAGTTDRLVLDLSRAHRDELVDASYSMFLYEVTPGAKRDPLGVITYVWLTTPAPYVPGQPREPSALLINFTTSTCAVSRIPVYEVSGAAPGSVPGYASESLGGAEPLPQGIPARLFVVGEGLFIKIGLKTFGIAFTGQDV